MLNISYSSRLFFGALTFYILLCAGCKKLLSIDLPANNISAENVYSTDPTAIAVLSGIYIEMTPFLSRDMALYLGLSADEMVPFDVNDQASQRYYRNMLTPVDREADFWTRFYSTVYVTNAAIEGLKASEKLTPEVKKQLTGEAYFLRAFCYFNIVNIFGDAPLAITTNYKVNALLERQPVAKVYAQIISDLKEAQALLSDKYLNGSLSSETPDRVRPNKHAATALLARAYLYAGDYGNAEVESSKVIERNQEYKLGLPNEAFLKSNNKEAIWQIQSQFVANSGNTNDGNMFVLYKTGQVPGVNPVYLSRRIANDFEQDDKRKADWVDSITVVNTSSTNVYYYPLKYKTGHLNSTTNIEYITVLRLAEQFLIRAEARARLHDLDGAKEDIDVIRMRAGLLTTTATSLEELLDVIEHEYKVEYFTEWGHRWFTLKRMGRINDVMSIVLPEKGGGAWEPYKALYPIIQLEMSANPSLQGHQNPGYK